LIAFYTLHELPGRSAELRAAGTRDAARPAEATMNIDVPYGITKRLPRVDMTEARKRVTAALQLEGFGILTEIDVQRTLETKLGVTMGPYVILGACHPKLAHAAIGAEPGVGLLLPCNVVLAKDGEDVVVSAASPRSMFSVAGEAPALEPIAKDAEARIERAIRAA
jgi:uncharacterized protein (DUF302 family)